MNTQTTKQPEQDLISIAKRYAKADREHTVEKWVYVSIEYLTFINGIRHTTRLCSYDLPRDVYEKREWVIRWRSARFQCRYPRECVRHTLCHYDKRSGLDLGFNTLLGRLSSAKAQVTKVENAIAEYISMMNGQLFFDEETDRLLTKAREKLAQKQANYLALHEQVCEKTKKFQNNIH